MKEYPVQNFSNLYPISLEKPLFAQCRPYAAGMLAVGDGHEIYWEACGNAKGKPVLAVHGGPGSGVGPSWTQFFDPENYHIILFDQRGCGRSTPHAGDTTAGLDGNDTHNLMVDMEKFRALLHIDKWMLFAGSWGTTLALAYAVTYPQRVSELLLWSVTTTRRQEIDWLSWQMGNVFPNEFEAFLAPVQGILEDRNIPLAYNRLLTSPDPAIHMPASWAWCAWEDRIVTLGNHVPQEERFQEDRFRLCFTRLVTRYFGNYAFLDDSYIMNNLSRIGHVPVVLVRGRLDICSPLSVAWNLHKGLPLSDLYIIDDSGHGTNQIMQTVITGAAEHFINT